MVNLWGGDSWFSVNGIYSDEAIGKPWMYAQCKSEYQNASGLQPFYPQFMKEGCYEGDHGATEQFIRSQNWQAMLGGCWGYCWGNTTVWQFASGWASQLNTTGVKGAVVVNKFFSQRAWQLLVPDWGNAFLTNGGSYTNANFASAAQASDGTWGAIYVPVNESLTVALSGFTRRVGAFWLDPTNGSVRSAINGTLGTTGSHTFAATPGANAAGDNDWVLLFEAPLNCNYHGSD
jgi:hypothetical protein